jgi:RNA polymerase sigma factor (sigma-70 family)
LEDVEDTRVVAASGLEAVYRTDGPAIWRALLAFSGDAAVAEDALSEAFAQALGRGDALSEPTRWIWRAAFRIAAGELKDRRRRSGELSIEPAYELPESIQHVVDALGHLSPNQRLAVVMHDYADRPVSEVAATIGATRATVHVHLSQGRKRLRAMLEDDDA